MNLTRQKHSGSLSSMTSFFLILYALLVADLMVRHFRTPTTAHRSYHLVVEAKWWERLRLYRIPEKGLPLTSRSTGVYPYSGTIAAHSTAELLRQRESREAFARTLWGKLEAKGEFSSCWKDALSALHMRCTPNEKNENGIPKDTLRTQLAFHLAKCDAEDDGRSPGMFGCSEVWEDVRRCVQSLTDPAYGIFVQYRLHADVLCAYLQEEVFQQRTEAAVAALHEETIAAVASTIRIEELENEMLTRIQESVRLQISSHGTLQDLEEKIQVISQEHQDSINSAQGSVRELLNTSDVIHTKWLELYEAFQTAAETALQSIYQLSNLTVLQLDQIQFTANNIREELRELESAQEGILSSFTHGTFQWWMDMVIGGTLILLFTSLPLTRPARVPAMSWWLLSALFPSLLHSLGSSGMHAGAQYHRFLMWASALPWGVCGSVGSAICILGVAMLYRRSDVASQRDHIALLQLLSEDSGVDSARRFVRAVEYSPLLQEKRNHWMPFRCLSWRQHRKRPPVPRSSRNSTPCSSSISQPVAPHMHCSSSPSIVLSSASDGNGHTSSVFSSPVLSTEISSRVYPSSFLHGGSTYEGQFSNSEGTPTLPLSMTVLPTSPKEMKEKGGSSSRRSVSRKGKKKRM